MTLPDTNAVQQHIVAFEAELAAASTSRDAQTIRDKYLGRKNSIVASWMQLIATAPPEQKREIGRLANELKQAVEARWSSFVEQSPLQTLPADSVDVTLPGRIHRLGHLHPLTLVRARMEATFTRMGFTIVEGPEIEDE